MFLCYQPLDSNNEIGGIRRIPERVLEAVVGRQESPGCRLPKSSRFLGNTRSSAHRYCITQRQWQDVHVIRRSKFHQTDDQFYHYNKKDAIHQQLLAVEFTVYR